MGNNEPMLDLSNPNMSNVISQAGDVRPSHPQCFAAAMIIISYEVAFSHITFQAEDLICRGLYPPKLLFLYAIKLLVLIVVLFS